MSKSALPMMQIVIEMPTLLDPKQKYSRARRVQSQAVRYALMRALKYHHRKRIRRHFKQDAKTRYSHWKRTSITIRRKTMKWGLLPDLVKTGRLRDKIYTQTPKMFIRGKWGGAGPMRGVLRLRFPDDFKSSKFQGGVTTDKMAVEIGRFSDDEVVELRRMFREDYVKFIKQWMRSNRRKIRTTAQLRSTF